MISSAVRHDEHIQTYSARSPLTFFASQTPLPTPFLFPNCPHNSSSHFTTTDSPQMPAMSSVLNAVRSPIKTIKERRSSSSSGNSSPSEKQNGSANGHSRPMSNGDSTDSTGSSKNAVKKAEKRQAKEDHRRQVLDRLEAEKKERDAERSASEANLGPVRIYLGLLRIHS